MDIKLIERSLVFAMGNRVTMIYVVLWLNVIEEASNGRAAVV
jgi:hypothetical protein